MAITTGKEKLKIGHIQFDMLRPELNHTAISESRCQRVSVSNTDKKMVSDKIMGRNLMRPNPNIVVMASFGIRPSSAMRTR